MIQHTFTKLAGKSLFSAILVLSIGRTWAAPLLTSNEIASIFSQPGVGLWELGSVSYGSNDLPHGLTVDSSWKSLAAGSQFCLAVDGSGALFAWGDAYLGQQDTGNAEPTAHFATKVGTDNDWKSVSANDGLSTAIKNDGSLWAWENANGPIRIGGGTTWKSTATGSQHRLALRTDGSIWAWGSNNHGNLGDGSTTFRDDPVQVGTATDWASISCGYYTSYGIKNDGSLWMWGIVFGTGNSGSSSSTVPIRLGTANNWRAIFPSPDNDVAFAIKQDGTLWAWGENDSGILGLGDNVTRNSPVQVGPSTAWESIAPGTNHVIAIRSDGSLWIWGISPSAAIPPSTVPVDRTALFDPNPKILVLEGSDDITDGNRTVTLFPAIVQEPTSKCLRISNKGLLPMTFSAIQLPPGFMLDPAPLVVPPLDGISYRIRLSASAKGHFIGDAHILNNSTNFPDVSIPLDGWVVSADDDTDSDGMNDAAELALSALGFDWRFTQTALVETLMENAPFAGLYQESEVMDVRLGIETIAIAPVAETASLAPGLREATTGLPLPFAMSPLPGLADPAIRMDFQIPPGRSVIRISGGK